MTEKFLPTWKVHAPVSVPVLVQIMKLVYTAGLACFPVQVLAHLLDGSPDPLPRWVPIAGLIIVGIMGGTVGFAISRHRASMEQKKKQRLQRAAEAGASPAKPPPPAETP